MSTQDQTNANRKNAQSSTGPKTDEGKATASQNAVKHGFFAKNDVISGEDLVAYEAHRQDVYNEYAPLGPTESVLTQRIASLTWRLMRADRLQTTVINTLVAAQQKATPPPVRDKFNITAMIETLRRKDKDPEYPISDAAIILAGLVRYKHKYQPVMTDPAVDTAIHDAYNNTGGAHICEAEIQLGTVIYNDFHGSAVIERLQGYEQKIETSLFKTIRQFQQFQETRRKAAAAEEERGWARFRAEDEAERNRKEAEYREMSMRSGDPPAADQRTQNKPNPNPRAEHEPNPDPRAEHEPNPRTGTACRAPNAQNEPNSELTSITEMTYNRSRYAKAKRNEPSQPNLTNPDDHPDRSDNKQTKRPTENPPK